MWFPCRHISNGSIVAKLQLDKNAKLGEKSRKSDGFWRGFWWKVSKAQTPVASLWHSKSPKFQMLQLFVRIFPVVQIGPLEFILNSVWYYKIVNSPKSGFFAVLVQNHFLVMILIKNANNTLHILSPKRMRAPLWGLGRTSTRWKIITKSSFLMKSYKILILGHVGSYNIIRK